MDTAVLDLKHLIALFLSETLRSRRTSLSRAAEISERVLSRLPSIKSEDQALGMLTDIEKDFQEVVPLKQALHFGYKDSDVKIYEEEIKAYASQIFAHNIEESNNFLQDASKPNATIQELCLKHPEFCDYLLKNSNNRESLKGLQII